MILVLWALTPMYNTCFTPQRVCQRNLVTSKAANICLSATLDFTGDSSDTLQFEVVDTSKPSFIDWLQSSHSDAPLLGSSDIQLRPDGLWDCRQPRVAWFGVNLIPVFVNRIDRIPLSGTAIVSIVQARTDILPDDKKRRVNQVIASVMEQSTFVGKSVIQARQYGDTSFTVSVDLSLTLQVPLPPYLLLPPGFNMIGSSIIRNTCRTRTKIFLQSLVRAYQSWDGNESKLSSM